MAMSFLGTKFPESLWRRYHKQSCLISLDLGYIYLFLMGQEGNCKLYIYIYNWNTDLYSSFSVLKICQKKQLFERILDLMLLLKQDVFVSFSPVSDSLETNIFSTMGFALVPII